MSPLLLSRLIYFQSIFSLAIKTTNQILSQDPHATITNSGQIWVPLQSDANISDIIYERNTLQQLSVIRIQHTECPGEVAHPRECAQLCASLNIDFGHTFTYTSYLKLQFSWNSYCKWSLNIQVSTWGWGQRDPVGVSLSKDEGKVICWNLKLPLKQRFQLKKYFQLNSTVKFGTTAVEKRWANWSKSNYCCCHLCGLRYKPYSVFHGSIFFCHIYLFLLRSALHHTSIRQRNDYRSSWCLSWLASTSIVVCQIIEDGTRITVIHFIRNYLLLSFEKMFIKKNTPTHVAHSRWTARCGESI